MSLFKGKRNYFALSFSDDQLQLTQADKKGRLRSYSKKDLPPGLIERGMIKNKEELSRTVDSFLKSVKLKHKFVVVGLPEIQAFTRVLTFPSLPIEELNDAVGWESEPLLPFPLDKAYLDWMILEKTKKKVRVLVVALPQGLVESYAQVLEKLGFQPVAFEITSLSLARLIEKDGVATMAIELKEKEAILVIVGPGGGIEVSSTISFKDDKGAEGELLSTIGKLLSFYQSKRVVEDGRKKIAKIVLCGPGAKAEWARLIEQRTGIKSEILSIKRPDLASVISLARKDVAAPIDEKTINLIPPRIQGLYDQTTKVREVSAWLKFSLVCLFLTFFSYSLVAAHVYFETKRIEGQIIELQASITPQVIKIQEKAKLLNSQAQKIVSLAGSQADIIPLLSLIRNNKPGGILITHCSFDGDREQIFVNGVADHRGDLLSFRENLQKTGSFSNIYIPLSSLGREADVRFSISITSRKESS